MMFKVNRSRTLEKRAQIIFGVTDNPLKAGYITTDGKYLNFPSAVGNDNIPDRSHFRIARLGTGIKEKITVSKYLDRTGGIRTQITTQNASFEIRKVPTNKQFDAMQRAGQGRKMYVDYTDSMGQTKKSSEFSDFVQAKDWILRNVK